MIDSQTLALLSPIALVVCVAAIVLLEEMSNQRAMKREQIAAEAKARTETHRGQMTIETGRFVFETKYDAPVKQRVS